MEKQYKLAKGWAVFIWIVIPAVMIGLGVFLVSSFLDETRSQNALISISLFVFLFELLMVYGLLDMVKRAYIIKDDKIIERGIFRTKILQYTEIEGLRKDDNYLYVLPKDPLIKKIKISTYVGHYNELYAFLNNKITDLDIKEEVEEYAEILKDEEFGQDIEERQANLDKAKKFTKILNIFGTIIPISFFFFDNYKEFLFLLTALYPIFVLLIYQKSNIIKLDGKNNSARPHIIISLIIAPGILFLTSLLTINILSYDNFWLKGFSVFVFFSIFIFYKLKEKNNISKMGSVIGYIIGFSLMSSMYSYGVVINANALFDNSIPKVYKSQVLSKHISKGKHTSYNLALKPWGPQTETEEVDVGKQFYNQKSVGDSISIYLYKGGLSIQHYKLGY